MYAKNLNEINEFMPINLFYCKLACIRQNLAVILIFQQLVFPPQIQFPLLIHIWSINQLYAYALFLSSLFEFSCVKVTFA